MPNRSPRTGTDDRRRDAGQSDLRPHIGRMLSLVGGLVVLLSLALVHVSALVLAQIYAIASEGTADHALADAAALYWVFVLAGLVVAPLALALAAAGYGLFGRSSLSGLLAVGVRGAPGRVLFGTGLLVVVPPAVAYGGTAVLGPDRFGTVLVLVAGSFLGGIVLLASVLLHGGPDRTE